MSALSLSLRRCSTALGLAGMLMLGLPAAALAEELAPQEAQAALSAAIDKDSAGDIAAALQAGASLKAVDAQGATPLIEAVAGKKLEATRTLLERGADANVRDAQGNSPISLAVLAHKIQPQLLETVLNFGANPNTQRPDGEPAILRLVALADRSGIDLMQQRGADLNVEADDQPLVVHAAVEGDWDIAWHLVELGARTDTREVQEGLLYAFKTPGGTPPDSPFYDGKVKLWQRLKDQGVLAEPPMGMAGR